MGETLYTHHQDGGRYRVVSREHRTRHEEGSWEEGRVCYQQVSTGLTFCRTAADFAKTFLPLEESPTDRPTTEPDAEQEMVSCPWCDGTGIVAPRQFPYRCAACQGRRVVSAERVRWVLAGVEWTHGTALDAGASADVLADIVALRHRLHAALEGA
jgi:hypothetical protein